MATATAITDHDEIRQWVEKRGGRPARVSATGKGADPGILRIDFPGYSGEDTLEEITWDEFFEWFDRNRLAILLTDKRGSRFSKFVKRSGQRAASSGRRAGAAKKAGGGKKAASKKPASKKAASKKAASKKAGGKKSAAKKSAAKKTSSKKTARRR